MPFIGGSVPNSEVVLYTYLHSVPSIEGVLLYGALIREVSDPTQSIVSLVH